MVDKTFIFRRLFHKKLHHIQVFDVRYDWQSGSGSSTLLPLPASASTFLLQYYQMLHFTLEKHRKG